jgi:pyrroloquinoline quinone biosynthesis protein B
VCALAWAGDPRVKRRTQSSIAVSLGDAPVVLVNATPDVGEQIRATPRLWPAEGLRHSPIAAVLLTSGEVDHTAGLLTLRERQPFSLVALPPVHAALVESRIFDVLGADIVPRVAAVPAAPMDIVPSLSIELFPVPGKVPCFSRTTACPRSAAKPEKRPG